MYFVTAEWFWILCLAGAHSFTVAFFIHWQIVENKLNSACDNCNETDLRNQVPRVLWSGPVSSLEEKRPWEQGCSYGKWGWSKCGYRLVERLPFEWNSRWIFLDKWNCTFSHQENGTDWAVSFDSKFLMQVFSRAIKLKSSNHESKSKTQEPTAKT